MIVKLVVSKDTAERIRKAFAAGDLADAGVVDVTHLGSVDPSDPDLIECSRCGTLHVAASTERCEQCGQELAAGATGDHSHADDAAPAVQFPLEFEKQVIVNRVATLTERTSGVACVLRLADGGGAQALGNVAGRAGELAFPEFANHELSEHPIRLTMLISMRAEQTELRVTASLHYGQVRAPQAGQTLRLLAQDSGPDHELEISYGGDFFPLDVAVAPMQYVVALRFPQDASSATEYRFGVPFEDIATLVSRV